MPSFLPAFMALAALAGPTQEVPVPDGYKVDSMKKAIDLCNMLVENNYIFGTVGACISDMNQQFTTNCEREDFRKHIGQIYGVKIEKKADCIQTMRKVVTGQIG